MEFNEKRSIGYCGLACVLCSYEDCPGCAAKIAGGNDCSTGKCVAEKGIDGCYACPEYPCKEGMLQGKRNRAFNRFARKFGKQALIDRLRINYENGITYHKPDQAPGDYDVLESEDEIYKLLRFGTSDPYKKCPILETPSFTLRLVSEDDAEDLLVCYSDPTAREIFNADNCINDFRYNTLGEMTDCIRFWLDAYQEMGFVRLSIVDNKTQKPIGTVEVFSSENFVNETAGGVLRIDLASEYETTEYITELLSLFNDQLFDLFNAETIITKAVPAAKERIEALQSAGYEPFHWNNPGREHYFSRTAQ